MSYRRVVLFLLFGSSGSGKTFTLKTLRERLPELAIHDFDEIGVPAGADTSWRHRTTEEWVQRALHYQAEGVDLVLGGNTPLGELLATPSADGLDGIAACLIDCDDETRVARLQARGSEWLSRSGNVDFRGYLGWAEWMRQHAADPTWQPEVIRVEATMSEMRWERWSGWSADDPRWCVRVIDTSRLPVERVADELTRWIEEERALAAHGIHPLRDPALHVETGE